MFDEADVKVMAKDDAVHIDKTYALKYKINQGHFDITFGEARDISIMDIDSN